MVELGSRALAFLSLALAAALLRSIVGVGPYSGKGIPPKYGDYEAQRHWMEVTTNLPPRDWYRETPDNDLTYWGIDYPPLSAYQSWLHGKLVGWAEPAAVELHASRGYESDKSKLAMRHTVLLSDLLCYFPAAFAAAAVLASAGGLRAQLPLAAGLLLSPALVLIDHGHFQYNCISLGAALGAVAAIAAGWEALGAALFCASLNHKQMSLYFAPAFFAHLLGRCLARRGWGAKLAALARIGLTVLASFALAWAPFLRSPAAAVAVLARLFPTQRGLYEDYVANFWCASSRLIKWKALLSTPALVRACTACTAAAFLPAMAAQVLRPSTRGFLLCLANSAMAFFLFSFQVHEKSILLPLLPVAVLAYADGSSPSDARVAAWAQLLAPFSMYPLLKKDGLSLQYVGATVFFWAATRLVPEAADGLLATELAAGSGSTRRKRQAAAARSGGTGSGSSKQQAWPAWVRLALREGPKISLAGALALHACELLVEPPKRYPFLWDAALTTWAFLHFAALFAYTNAQQWREFCRAAPHSSSKAKRA